MFKLKKIANRSGRTEGRTDPNYRKAALFWNNFLSPFVRKTPKWEECLFLLSILWADKVLWAHDTHQPEQELVWFKLFNFQLQNNLPPPPILFSRLKISSENVHS